MLGNYHYYHKYHQSQNHLICLEDINHTHFQFYQNHNLLDLDYLQKDNCLYNQLNHHYHYLFHYHCFYSFFLQVLRFFFLFLFIISLFSLPFFSVFLGLHHPCFKFCILLISPLNTSYKKNC